MPKKPTSDSGANDVALNFRVSAAFKREFKVAAAQHEITQSQLLRDAFLLWQQHKSDQR